MTKPRILQPLDLGPKQARNRLWMPPMCMYNVPEEDGVPTPWHVLHYATRAQGGFGTVIVEATAVEARGRLSSYDLGIWDDSQIEGHRAIVDAVHAGGALAGVQLGHGGRKSGTAPWRPDATKSRQGTLPDWDLIGPSPIAYPDHAVPRELTTQQVRGIVTAFVDAAARAVEAGYDVIELHGAHGYLIHEFLSPLSNEREDEFGGSVEGRRRFPLEVVRAVRGVIGPDRVLDIRVSATDWAEGGLTGEETADFARELVEAGVDVVHVSTGGNVPGTVPIGPGYQVPFAAQVKEALAGMTTAAGAAPVVVAVGIIEDGAQAEEVLASGEADAIAVGRVALRDPYVPLRWAHELGVNDWEEAGFPVPYWRGAWRR